MCGRYTLTSAPEAIRALFRYDEQPNFPPRFNVAPTQPIAIVRLHEGKRQFALVRWGLLPSWVKDPKAFSLLINARGESVTDKPAFRNAMKRRRCLIPADGFYEWQAGGARKRPFYVRAKSRRAARFRRAVGDLDRAERRGDGNGGDRHHARQPHAGAIHDRMPVIVPPEAFDLWLNSNEVDATTAAALITPAPDSLLEVFEISTDVNRVANDNPKLIEPVVPGQPAPASEARRKTRHA